MTEQQTWEAFQSALFEHQACLCYATARALYAAASALAAISDDYQEQVDLAADELAEYA